MRKEDILHRQVCDYLRAQYPSVIFTSEASGLRLTIGQAKKMKGLRSRNGLPDLMIFEAKGIYHGLLIELKAEGEKLTKKTGEWKTDHLAEQGAVICDLTCKGYLSDFAVGFKEAKSLIDAYMTKSI